MTNQNNRKSPVNLGSIMIRVAAVLFFLVLLSLHLLSGLFARYVSGGNGIDNARVAGFDVRLSGVTDGMQYEVTAIEPGKVTVSLENQSEVAVSYSLRVDAGAPAYGIEATWAEPNESKTTPGNAGDGTVMQFDSVRHMAVGGTDECTLSFDIVDWKNITKDAEGESAVVTQSFTVYIDVVQVD